MEYRNDTEIEYEEHVYDLPGWAGNLILAAIGEWGRLL